MPKHSDQRVGVFIDVQNLYYSAKQLYNAKVNFAHILKRAVAGRRLIRAIAYVIKADIKEEHNFFEALEKIGYDVRSKDLQTFYTGAKKGDWDVGIAMDIMRMAAKLDVIVLVSGDGDFKDLLEHVKALGCRAEVLAFGKTSSSRLIGEADEFGDLGKELDKVLIKGNSKAFRTDNKPAASSGGTTVTAVPAENRPESSGRAESSVIAANDIRNEMSRERRNFRHDRMRGNRGFRRPDRNMGGGRDFRRPMEPSDSASLLQKINMDQPVLEPRKEEAKLVMPKDEPKKEEPKKEEPRREEPKERAPEKPAEQPEAKKTAKKPAKKAVPKKKK